MPSSYSRLFQTLLLASTLLATPLQAQEWHTVGTGTATNGANGIPCPFGDIYAGQRAQYIYLASELSAAGLVAGDAIVKVRWVVTALNGSGMHENYTIRLGNTAASSLSGLQPNPTGASTTPVDYQPVVGNNDFTLNTPFIWNGTSNLLVEVTHFSPTYGTASANASVAFTSTAPVKRSYSLLDDLMFSSGQTIALAGEILNSTGLPNIVLGVATDCPPLTATGMTLCQDAEVPPDLGLEVSGCGDLLGGNFRETVAFPGTNLACTGTDYTLRASINLPELPDGASVVAGRLILQGVEALDPVWLSDLYLKLDGSIEGEIQLMPAFDEYSGTVPELIIAITGPYEAGVTNLYTASAFGTGHIGSARVEFDYLLPTPFWYDAPTGGNRLAYGISVFDPVAEGLASTATPGTTTFYADCGVTSTACTGSRVPVELTVVPAPEPSFTVEPAVITQGVPATFTYTGTPADSYFWDFGDGDTGTGMAVVHEWAEPGTYTVVLTVTVGECDGSISQEVTVEVNTGVGTAASAEGFRVRTDGNMIHIDRGDATGPLQVRLLDATGRVVVEQTARASSERIEVPCAGLPTGLWYVHLSGPGMQRTFRVPLVH